MPCGKTLRIAVLKPAIVHWSMDGWNTSLDTHTRDTGWACTSWICQLTNFR